MSANLKIVSTVFVIAIVAASLLSFRAGLQQGYADAQLLTVTVTTTRASETAPLAATNITRYQDSNSPRSGYLLTCSKLPSQSLALLTNVNDSVQGVGDKMTFYTPESGVPCSFSFPAIYYRNWLVFNNGHAISTVRFFNLTQPERPLVYGFYELLWVTPEAGNVTIGMYYR